MGKGLEVGHAMERKPPYKLVLWDFDGTLVDTSKGIFRSLCWAFDQAGLPEPSGDILKKFIGPPLMHTLAMEMNLHGTAAEELVRLFRADYEREGIYEAEVFPGIEELISRLHSCGIKNAVATLKPQGMAITLLEHFGIAPLIDVCCGASHDEKQHVTKAQVIQRAMEHLNISDLREAVMIGDTVFDEEGAREAGVDFIAVSYGFGITETTAKEMQCLFTAPDADALTQFFFPT